MEGSPDLLPSLLVCIATDQVLSHHAASFRQNIFHEQRL